MRPRHFWYLLETLQPQKKSKAQNIDRATHKRLKRWMAERNEQH